MELSGTLPGQKFALVSFIKESDKIAMRIYGVFPDEDSAQKHCKKIMDLDNRFDIFMTHMNVWIPCAPTKEHIQEEHYYDHFLEDLMTGYEKQQHEVFKEHEQRKREALEKIRLEQEEAKRIALEEKQKAIENGASTSTTEPKETEEPLQDIDSE